MLMVMPVQALIRNHLEFNNFQCAANLGGAEPLKRNTNCSGVGGDPPIIKKGATLVLASVLSTRSFR